jgi:hypothetical protein
VVLDSTPPPTPEAPGSQGGRELLLAAGGGAAWPAFGRGDLSHTSMPAVTLTVLHGWRLGRGRFELGLLLAEARLAFARLDGRGHASHFPAGFIQAGAGVELPDALSLVATAGAGVTWWTGLVKDNPFTIDGVAATGAVPLPSVRLGAALRRPLGERYFVGLSPALVLARPSGGLADALEYVRVFSVALELGLRS